MRIEMLMQALRGIMMGDEFLRSLSQALRRGEREELPSLAREQTSKFMPEDSTRKRVEKEIRC